MKKKTRLILSAIIILSTIGGLIYYISKHQNLLTKLSHTPPSVILLILVLYAAWLYSLVLILQAILYMCRTKIGTSDNILLNAYSLFANFFIPGQAGPALRGVYLKKRHNVRYRDYIYGMLVYYFFYGVISVVLLLAGSRPWWQTVTALIVTACVGALVFKLYEKRLKEKSNHLLGIKGGAFLLAATLLQAFIQVSIYFVEVHTVNRQIVLHQVITYTGAANLALFVGLTPGAIGIRESFLVLTERLHHISSSVIIEANVIDRAVYLVFLGLLFLLILSMHAGNKIRMVTQVSSEADKQ
jgi:uncharacterized membrane protein YbhN (UPF0104 family)